MLNQKREIIEKFIFTDENQLKRYFPKAKELNHETITFLDLNGKNMLQNLCAFIKSYKYFFNVDDKICIDYYCYKFIRLFKKNIFPFAKMESLTSFNTVFNRNKREEGIECKYTVTVSSTEEDISLIERRFFDMATLPYSGIFFNSDYTGIYIESFYRNSDTMFTFTINRILHQTFSVKAIKAAYKNTKNSICMVL